MDAIRKTNTMTEDSLASFMLTSLAGCHSSGFPVLTCDCRASQRGDSTSASADEQATWDHSSRFAGIQACFRKSGSGCARRASEYFSFEPFREFRKKTDWLAEFKVAKKVFKITSSHESKPTQFNPHIVGTTLEHLRKKRTALFAF
jgi:hypothetical protein